MKIKKIISTLIVLTFMLTLLTSVAMASNQPLTKKEHKETIFIKNLIKNSGPKEESKVIYLKEKDIEKIKSIRLKEHAPNKQIHLHKTLIHKLDLNKNLLEKYTFIKLAPYELQNFNL